MGFVLARHSGGGGFSTAVRLVIQPSLFLLVIPAQAGIQLLRCFEWFESRASTRPADVRVTFFLQRRKVTKRRRLRRLRPSSSCPKGPRQRPGSANCTSVCNSGIGAIHRADPRRPCRPPPPQCNGDQEKPEPHASCAPKPKQEAHIPHLWARLSCASCKSD